MKLGIIGAGNHFSKNIAPLFFNNLIDDFELPLVHSRSRYEEFSDLGFATTESAQDIFNQDLDAVYISLPNSLHAQAIEQALDLNLHVICEKTLIIPGTMNLGPLSNDLRVKEAFMYQHHPLTKAVSRHLQSSIATNVSIEFIIPHLGDADIRYDPSLGGGALLDLGAYTISAMRYFFPHANLCEIISNKHGYDVDISGTANYVCPIWNTQITLNWGFGSDYKNQMSWTCDRGVFQTSRFFSKNLMEPGYIFCIVDKYKEQVVEKTQIENHFINMFKSFNLDISMENFDNSAEIRQQRDLFEIIVSSDSFEHLR